MRCLLFFSIFLAQQSFAQSYFLFENQQFYPNQINVLKVSKAAVTVDVLFYSSERCACETKLTVVLKKRANGTFIGHPYGHKYEVITAKMIDGKVQTLKVKGDEMGCCAIYSGTYLKKR